MHSLVTILAKANQDTVAQILRVFVNSEKPKLLGSVRMASLVGNPIPSRAISCFLVATRVSITGSLQLRLQLDQERLLGPLFCSVLGT